MDGRKLRRKRKIKLKRGQKRISFQEFIDNINGLQNEKQEMEALFSRVLILNSESVLTEMEIKKKNNEILQARTRTRAEENNEGMGEANAAGGTEYVRFDRRP
jgi:hypothetical protein